MKLPLHRALMIVWLPSSSCPFPIRVIVWFHSEFDCFCVEFVLEFQNQTFSMRCNFLYFFSDFRLKSTENRAKINNTNEKIQRNPVCIGNCQTTMTSVCLLGCYLLNGFCLLNILDLVWKWALLFLSHWQIKDSYVGQLFLIESP